MPTSQERLRRYVRARVRKDGELYEYGIGRRLAKAIGQSSSWVTEYADPHPAQHRYADLDTAFRICKFFGISLAAFDDSAEPHTQAPPTQPLSRFEARALDLLRRMNGKGQRLSVKLLVGFADEFPKRVLRELPGRANQKP